MKPQSAGVGSESVVRRAVFACAFDVLQFLASLDQPDVDPVADLLSRARLVICLGVGKSGIAARKIAATLRTLGIPSVALAILDLFHGDMGIAGSGTVFVLLSDSGTTPEVVTAAERLKQREFSVVALVGDLSSPLAKIADFSVCTSRPGAEATLPYHVPSASFVGATIMGDILAFEAAAKGGRSPSVVLTNHPAGAGRRV